MLLQVEAALREFPEGLYLDREKFLKALQSHLGARSFKPSASDLKWICQSLSQRDEEAEICTNKAGEPEPDPELRDYENVPLKECINEYFEREVKPHVPDAWIDESKTDEKDGKVGIIGYEIPFNRHFYKYVPPRPLEEIDRDLEEVSREIMELLHEVTA
jgi:type I restriction enzyme M protein